MSKDSQISLLSHMLRVSLDELVYSFVRGEIEKAEFLKKYEYNRQLERKYECCCEIGIDTLDWKELERRGQLCAVDYETFGLDKLGMSAEAGKRKYEEFRQQTELDKNDDSSDYYPQNMTGEGETE